MNTPDEMIACIQAHKDGKELQFFSNVSKTWEDVAGAPLFNFHIYEYRVKPTPSLRLWKPEEVPVGAAIRRIDTHNEKYLISAQRGDEFSITNHFDTYKTQVLLDVFEHSIDHGITWHPCGVME